ncbi:hypothetical protein C8R43DRAFT_1131421 [Mycena crocata]|nr:hypothetical protein C8R43DRAFT_1131421 [Mycena crocata]
MPPKGSGTAVREEDFTFNEDRSRVKCKVCIKATSEESVEWITVKAAPRHLDLRREHDRALKRLEEAERVLASLEKEREKDSATNELRGVQFTTHHICGPGGEASSRVMGEAEIDMWDDYRIHGANFSAGDEVDSSKAQQTRLRDEAKSFGLWNPEATARRLGFGEDERDGAIENDEEDDFLADVMHHIDLREPEAEEIQNDGCASNAGESAKWFPYPTKMAHNLPRLRLSGSLMRAFLWVLKEAQCNDVPSFDHLRRIQKEIRAQCGITTIPYKSVQGNVFFMNDPTAIIAKDWMNPSTRNHIHVYPEIPEDGVIREIWHARKWRKTMDLDILSPMYNAGISHYYVNEVARLRDGEFVIPIRWVKFRGKVYANAFSIIFDEQGEATIVDTETAFIRSEDLVENYYDLEQAGTIPKWGASSVEAGYSDRMPNPKRIIAANRPMYCSFVNYFGDDVSGNRTKSWNKHWNAYMTHVNLPRQLLLQEFHLHFISTSPNASVPEQFREFKAALEVTHTNPVEVRDEFGDAACICIYANAGPSDNPMQSEVAGHIGGKGRCPCRKCKVGGSQKEKCTDEGYHALFEVRGIIIEILHHPNTGKAGEPRSKEYILEELEKQVKLACSGVAQHAKDTQAETGVKDTYTQFWINELISRFRNMKKDEPTRSVADIQAELIQWTVENRDKIYGPFLTMKGFDPTKDTPVEILHTILLGLIKYIWHITHTPWSAEKKNIYAMRLQSTNTDGLSIHAIRSNYIMQYAGSLIGRQLKTLAQTSIFHVRGLVSSDHFMAWKAAGELAVLLWVPAIPKLDEYWADLKVAVANVLDIFATIDPSKIVSKIKYHLLVHLDEDAVDFGPLVGLATELFEAFNGVFRYCSILSNHLAPSPDIAGQLADQEGLKHRLTGGWWPSTDQDADGKWVQAGPGVRQFISQHPILQRLVGWTEKKVVTHGEMKLVPLKRGQKHRDTFSLDLTNAARALNYGSYTPGSTWRKCIHVISESLDQCFIDSWVFAKSPTSDEESTISGRVSDILVDSAAEVLIVLENFQILSSRDEVYGMPVLVRPYSEVLFTIVPAKNIKFKFNVQHDCNSAKCEATGVCARIQERVESDQTENYIVHEPLDRFIINSHAFHNAHLLRAILPRALIAPIPLFTDREAKHHELAAQLRETQTTQKAIAAEKKRKQAELGDDADDEMEERPKKRKKQAVRRRKKRQTPVVAVGPSMVATRGRRTIRQTEKAKATPEPESESCSEMDVSAASDSDSNFYDDSDQYLR